MPQTTPVQDPQTPNVVMRFLTQGGAIVQVTKTFRTTFWDKSNPTGREPRYPYECLGCGYQNDDYTSIYEPRRLANEHASTCHAMPRPTA